MQFDCEAHLSTRRTSAQTFVWHVGEQSQYTLLALRRKLFFTHYCAGCPQQHRRFVCKVGRGVMAVRLRVCDAAGELWVNGVKQHSVEVQPHPDTYRITYSHSSFMNVHEVLINEDRPVVVIAHPPSIEYVSDFVKDRLPQYRFIVTHTMHAAYRHLPHILAMAFAFALPFPPQSIVIQLEQHYHSPWLAKKTYIEKLRRGTHLLDYSLDNLRHLRHQHQLSGSHLRLGTVPQYAQELEAADRSEATQVVLYGSVSGQRRPRLLAAIRQQGLPVKVIKGLRGPAMRQALLKHARVILNLHYWERSVLEQCRLYESLSLGLTVVSETSDNMDEQPAALLAAVRFVPQGNVTAIVEQLRAALAEPLPPPLHVPGDLGELPAQLAAFTAVTP